MAYYSKVSHHTPQQAILILATMHTFPTPTPFTVDVACIYVVRAAARSALLWFWFELPIVLFTLVA